MAKGVGVLGSTDSSEPNQREEMIIASGPTVGHGVILSDFLRMWSVVVGLFCSHGPGAKI